MKRVIVHVGCPKTGTSHLQHVLFRNRLALQWQGIDYPCAQPEDRHDGQFLAALDLMSLPWGGLEVEAVGAWERLITQAREWLAGAERPATFRRLGAEERADLAAIGLDVDTDQPALAHTVIISHEILARATPTQIERALVDLGRDEGVEIHVVVSARDLVRQIPAEWQENVKHRAGLSYAEFLAQLADESRSGRIASWFWAVQELPDILARWGASLPPERVHVVTVPPASAPRELLWQRFVEVFGLADLALHQADDRDNPSLGVPETALIRRVNQRGIPAIEPIDYRPMVRELLAHQTLSRRTGSDRLVLPPASQEWAAALSQQWVEQLRAAGYDVVGDLADLVGHASAAAYADPDAPDEAEVADAAVDAIVALVLEVGRMRREHEQFEHRVVEAEHQAYLASRGVKGQVYDAVAATNAGRRALRGYRRLRGSSSRSA